jgi:hypothetical protein
LSNALAIGAVTAVLRDLLNNGLIDHDVPAAVGDVTVSALPLDRVVSSSNGDDQNQLNLFLHRVTPNLGWRNASLPTFDQNGRRVSNTPLALDLHYLLTAYGSEDFHAEILLGYAMQLIHETPVLSREAIRRALGAPSPVGGDILPPTFRALSAAELADQVEQIKLSPESLDTEEISKLWAAFQSAYRTTVAYQATVVLIEGRHPIRSAQPVLKRGEEDRGALVGASPKSPFPMLEEVVPPNQEEVPPERRQPIARLGETFALRGQNLEADVVAVRFDHRLLDEPIEVEIRDSARTPTELSVRVPNAPARWPAGLYGMTVALRSEGEDGQNTDALERTTNALPLLLAPKIANDLMPAEVVRGPDGTVNLRLRCSPQVRPQQRVSVLVGDREVFANDHPQPTATLNFEIRNAPLGEHRLRLRVDDVDSLLVNRSTWPPTFDETQKVTIT